MKKTILCLVMLFMASLNAAATLPVVPLPKAVVTNEAGNGACRYYSEINLIWQGTDAKPYEAVTGEIKALERHTLTTRMNIAASLTSKKTDLRQFCKRHGLNSAYADSIGTEGYLLARREDRMELMARSENGLFYALQTAKQLLREGYTDDLAVADWSDLQRRVFFDDISRGPISHIDYIKKQIRDLSELKYNGLTFYIEHVIQPLYHPDFAPANGKLTMADVRELSEYAARYHMELIGSFQCFGHFEKILEQPRYAPLADTPGMIAPLNPDAQRFLKEVIEELCDAFSSDYFNINCDETWDLESGRTSREHVARIGADQFYADHIRFLYNIVKGKGKKVMMWGDIIMKYPHLIKQLPRDITYLTWEYSGSHYEPWVQPFRDGKCRFMVCPGILNSNRLYPDLGMTRENMQFIHEGYHGHARGMMYTSWDDSGLHGFACVMPGVAMAADHAWNASRPAYAGEQWADRYCRMRLSDPTPAFVRTMECLNRLGKLGLTYEMNDRIYYDRFTPEAGQVMNLNADELQAAHRIIDEADGLLAGVSAGRNTLDVDLLRHAIAQYRFIVTARERMLALSRLYEEALTAAPRVARRLLVDALDHAGSLETDAVALKTQSARLWLAENQSYYLDYGLGKHEEKMAEASRVSHTLLQAIDRIDRDMQPLPTEEAGLAVRCINSNYLACWLYAGSFANGSIDTDYLAEQGGESGVKPIPGGRFNYGEGDYKWSRSNSANGFVMDFNELFHSTGNGIAYAYATLESDTEQTVTLLLGCSGECRFYLNGRQVGATAKENEFVADKYPISLHLQPGVNRLMIKSRQLVKDWKFSTRIDGRVVKAHKQKFRL